jgi:hypothetical protein
LRARPPGGGCENRRTVLAESEKVGVTFGMAWPHMARHRPAGKTPGVRCPISAPAGSACPRAFSAHRTPSLKLHGNIFEQSRIASGREQVRFSPIENALRLRLLPFKQGRGSLRPRAVGSAPQVHLFAPIRTPRLYQRLRFLRRRRPPLSRAPSVADQLS